MKIHYVLLCCCAIVFGCKQFTPEKLNTETVLKNQLKTFNWNTVDTYPKFINCDTIINTAATKTCFQNIILQTITNTLKSENFVVNQAVKDTVLLTFNISNTGKIAIATIKSKPVTQVQLPQLDSVLKQSLTQLPKLYPAIKQGQQVHTQFTLPIIIAVN